MPMGIFDALLAVRADLAAPFVLVVLGVVVPVPGLVGFGLVELGLVGFGLVGFDVFGRT